MCRGDDEVSATSSGTADSVDLFRPTALNHDRHIGLKCGAALGIFLMAVAPSTRLLAQENKENSEFKLAVGLFNDGMYDLAVEQLKNFVNAYPNSAQGIEARFYLGETQMKLKRYDDARLTFQNFALTYVDHPKAAEAWMSVGDAFLALGNEREAALAYERLKVFTPKSPLVPEALLKAGRLERRFGDREGAKKDFRSIAQDFPASPLALNARLEMGEMYAEEGQTELAEKEARRVSESEAPPAVKAGALFSLGKLQAMMSLFDHARTTFLSLLKSYKNAPAVPAALVELGRIEAGDGEFTSAIDRFQKVTSDEAADDSLRAEALAGAGQAYAMSGQFGNAQKTLEKLASSFPHSSLAPAATLDAGRYALKGGSPSDALRDANTILAQHDSPLKRRALLLAASASIALRQYNDAVRFYSLFPSSAPEDGSVPDVLRKLAGVYEGELHDCRKAIGVYDQITQQFPQSPQVIDALVGVGRCQELLGDDQGALNTYLDLQSRYPAHDRYDAIRARIAFLRTYKIRNRDAGMEKLARLMGDVLTQNSKAELSFRLGEIYFNDLKDYQAAATQFAAAIDNGVDNDKFSEAYYLRARSFDLLTAVDSGAAQKALMYYGAYLKQFPSGTHGDAAAFGLYRLKSPGLDPAGIVALAGNFLSTYPASPHADTVEFDLASAELRAGDRASALKDYQALRANHPGTPLLGKALLEEGKILQEAGMTDSAAHCWQLAVELSSSDPSTAEALWNLADLRWRNRQYPEAIALWKRLTGEFGYSTFGRRASAMLPEGYLAIGDANEAVALYSARLEREQLSPLADSVDAALLFRTAAAYEKKGDRQKALKLYSEYLQQNRHGPLASKAFYALGALARAEGSLDAASSYFKEASALGGTGSASRDIADLLFQTEQYTEAAKQYGILAQTDSADTSRAYDRSRRIVALLRSNNLAEGEKLAAEFEKSDDDGKEYKAEFLYERAMVYFRKQDYAAGGKLFKKLSDDYDDTRYGPWGSFYTAKILEIGNKLDEAAKRYEEILKRSAGSDVIPRTLLSLGNMHFNAERYDQAIKYYQQITASPETAGDILSYAMNNLIEAYESMKVYDAAIKLTKDYIDRYPNDDHLIDKKIKLGTLYTRVGYYDQAVQYFQNLIGEAGSLLEAEIRYDIGEAYYDKGDYQQAILEFLKVPYLVSRQGKVDWTATSFYMAGQAYEKMSKFEEAIGMYRQIIDRPGIDATFKGAARKEIDRVNTIIAKGAH